MSIADNAQKTPLARSLNRIASGRAFDAIQILGKSLPASVKRIVSSGIVEVKFEITSPFTLPNVTVPMVGSEYIRYPIQVGCKGWVQTADAYLGGMSGLGGGVADLSMRANLTALVWCPLGNTAWDPSDNANATVIYGPDGVILRNALKTCKFELTDTGIVITLPPGGTMTIQGVGTSGVFVDAAGNVVVTAAAGKDVFLGANSIGGTKKVVLDGDPVSGGVVHASSTIVRAA